mmetsp:Transcript_25602/g.74735  ORF Transcript_25602/g.74735 Transcript_25602/m.74735 type:complete len:358 (-) Transcript_25602:186-1259(-)
MIQGVEATTAATPHEPAASEEGLRSSRAREAAADGTARVPWPTLADEEEPERWAQAVPRGGRLHDMALAAAWWLLLLLLPPNLPFFPERLRPPRRWWAFPLHVFRIVLWPVLGWLLGVLATLLSILWMDEFPCEAESVGWRGAITSVLTPMGLSEKFLRRILGVHIPPAPPFGRVFVGYWIPALSFLPGEATRATTANYHYLCTDSKHHDYSYHYTYDATHERYFVDSLSGLLHIIAFELVLSGVTYVVLLLALNLNLRQAASESLQRSFEKLYRVLCRRKPQPPRPVDDEVCPICYGEFLPHQSEEGIQTKEEAETEAPEPWTHCRWGCGRAVHVSCMQRWLRTRNCCVLCAATWD